jgi:hypothetical protein
MVEPLGVSRNRASDDPVLATLLRAQVGITTPARLKNEPDTTYTRRQRDIGHNLHEDLLTDPAYLDVAEMEGRPSKEMRDELQAAVERIQRGWVREFGPEDTTATRRGRRVRRVRRVRR